MEKRSLQEANLRPTLTNDEALMLVANYGCKCKKKNRQHSCIMTPFVDEENGCIMGAKDLLLFFRNQVRGKSKGELYTFQEDVFRKSLAFSSQTTNWCKIIYESCLDSSL